jgi:hypothetical protein
MTVLYRSTRSIRVRFLQVLFWAGAFGFAAMAVMNYIDGPQPDSWLVGAILAPIFVLFALGMEWYLRCYVTKLEASSDGLWLETLSTLGRARTLVAWSGVELAGVLHDQSDDDEAPTVDNTAAVLRVSGRSFLIIDTTEDEFDSEQLQRLIAAARVN